MKLNLSRSAWILLAAALLSLGCSRNSNPRPAVIASDTKEAETVPAPSPAAGNAAPEPVSTTPGGKADRPRVYESVKLLTIGIEKYASNTIDPATFAERDSKTLGELLHTGYGFAHEALDGPKATKAAILEAVNRLAVGAKENDAVIVFFAGHGVILNLDSYGRAGFLVPYDAQVNFRDKNKDPELWKRQTVEMRELTTILSRSAARHAVIILDACASGFLTRRGDQPAKLRPDQQELLARRSRAVLAACAEDEAAFPNRSQQLGTFTASLVARLKTEQPTTLTELFSDARTSVAAASNRCSLPQMGSFSFDDGEFVFVPLTVAEADVKVAMKNVMARLQTKEGRRTQPAHLYEVFDATPYHTAADRVTADTRWREKVSRFDENAGAGDPLAMAALSMASLKGVGTEADPREAYLWARRAFETGHPDGRAVLAHCLATGTGVAKNSLAAERLLTDPAGASPLSKLVLADLLRESNPAGDGRIAALYADAEQGGVSFATIRAVELFLDTPGPTAAQVDFTVKRLMPQADKGHPAANRLVYRAITMKPKPLAGPDQKLGHSCLLRAAEAGDGWSQSALAREYFQDQWLTGDLGLAANPQQAYRWATLAAANPSLIGEPMADVKQIVAMSLITGRGVAQNLKMGLDLANEAANSRSKNSVNMMVWQLTEATKYIGASRKP